MIKFRLHSSFSHTQKYHNGFYYEQRNDLCKFLGTSLRKSIQNSHKVQISHEKGSFVVDARVMNTAHGFVKSHTEKTNPHSIQIEPLSIFSTGP